MVNWKRDYRYVRTPVTPHVEFTLAPGATRPLRAYPGDAGWDLTLLDDPTTAFWVEPLERRRFRTGVTAAFPEGTYGRVVGRSSAFWRYGLFVIEGVIDSGFRGELEVGVFNPHPTDGVWIPTRCRLAQVIVSPFLGSEWGETDLLPDSERATAGFGSSGS